MSTDPPRSSPAEFRRRFLGGEVLLGTFVKTPGPHTTEALGTVGLDFVVIDEEHGPFDRGSIDLALLGARASGVAGLVRVSDTGHLLAALDDGATGVLVPHVDGPERAAEVVSLCRYRGGRRGFSNTTRAGGYGGRAIWQHVDAQDADVTVIAMIEDPHALEHMDAILATPGLDGAFIGRGDLTVALGAPGMDSSQTRQAAEMILAAAGRARKPICIMVANAAEAADWRALGASAFIVSSDQGLMRMMAAKVVTEFANLKTGNA
jgi:staphyloferrin B biosynthesis citrate synthase